MSEFSENINEEGLDLNVVDWVVTQTNDHHCSGVRGFQHYFFLVSAPRTAMSFFFGRAPYLQSSASLFGARRDDN